MTVLFFGSGHPEWLAKLTPVDDVVPVVKRKHAWRYPGWDPLYTVEDLASADEVVRVGLPAALAHSATRLVTLTEAAMLPVALLRQALDLPGQSVDEAVRFTNKFVMKRRLQRAGIPMAEFRPVRVGSELAAVGLPVPFVVKPFTGAGGVGVRRIDTAADWQAWTAAAGTGGYLAESWLSIRSELHCDAVVVDGTPVFCAVSQYFQPLLVAAGAPLGGYVLTDADPRAELARGLHRDVVTALRLGSGVTHMELFELSDGLVFGEIACRPGGGGITASVQAATGIDLVAAAFELQLGRQPSVAARSPEASYAWLGMPARPGTVREISDVADLHAIEGVLAATNHYAPGELIAGQTTSTFHATTLLLRVADPAEFSSVRAQVERRYRLAVT